MYLTLTHASPPHRGVTASGVRAARPTGEPAPGSGALTLLRRRELAVQIALVLIGCGLALAFTVPAEPLDRTIAVAAIAALAGVVVGVIVRLREQHARLVGELRMLATRDALTGALNRGAFDEFLTAEHARARRHGRPLSVLALDLDHFKRVNDRHGHAAGDAALRRLGRLVADNTRASDVFARVGGEEFLLLLPDTEPEHAEALAESLRSLVEDATRHESMPLTVSIGVAGTVGGPATGELVPAADRALYEAKRRGRNRVSNGPGITA